MHFYHEERSDEVYHERSEVISKRSEVYHERSEVISEQNSVTSESNFANQKTVVLAMKLTAVFLFAFCLHLAAKTSGQSVTLSAKNKPLEKIFAEIRKQTGYRFI